MLLLKTNTTIIKILKTIIKVFNDQLIHKLVNIKQLLKHIMRSTDDVSEYSKTVRSTNIILIVINRLEIKDSNFIHTNTDELKDNIKISIPPEKNKKK